VVPGNLTPPRMKSVKDTMPKYQCYRKECTRMRSDFSIFLNRKRPPKFESHNFCCDTCLFAYFENELNDKWCRLQIDSKRQIPRPKIGTILMQTAFITQEQLNEAIQLQNKMQEGRLGEWLLKLGFVDEHQITEALSKQYGLPLINLKNPDANSEAARMIPGKVAKRSGLVPVGFDDDLSMLRVAVSAPVDFQSQEAIRRMVHKGLLPFIAEQSAIQQLWERFYDPEELDLSNVPTYDSLEELLEIGREIVSLAIDNRALNIQAELIHDFFWMRLELPEETHHHFFRYEADADSNHVSIQHTSENLRYAIGT
jgi:hypothetical protein